MNAGAASVPKPAWQRAQRLWLGAALLALAASAALGLALEPHWRGQAQALSERLQMQDIAQPLPRQSAELLAHTPNPHPAAAVPPIGAPGPVGPGQEQDLRRFLQLAQEAGVQVLSSQARQAQANAREPAARTRWDIVAEGNYRQWRALAERLSQAGDTWALREWRLSREDTAQTALRIELQVQAQHAPRQPQASERVPLALSAAAPPAGLPAPPPRSRAPSP